MQGKRQDPQYQAEAILSRREHSVFEAQTKLRRKGFTGQQVADAIASLRQRGLLDDARFARLLIESTLRGKAVGPRWLAGKLRQKGVARPIIDEAIAAAFPPGTEEELAHRAADTWRRAHSPPARGGVRQLAEGGGSDAEKNLQQNQRLARFLNSRGFSHNAISAVVVKGVVSG